jgi:hypothetical protein
MKSVTLRDIRDSDGSRYLAATLTDDGSLTVEGQDIGAGVERFFGAGNREYEWVWKVLPDDVPRLAAALESGPDPLSALAERFSGDDAAGLARFLEEHEIPFETWSRVGA